MTHPAGASEECEEQQDSSTGRSLIPNGGSEKRLIQRLCQSLDEAESKEGGRQTLSSSYNGAKTKQSEY